MNYPQASQVDIALLLEGTYPFVRGGVSGWVHQLIQAFPEYRFAVVFIGGVPDQYGELRYELPPQVVHVERHFVHAPELNKPPIRSFPGNPRLFKFVGELHEWMRAPETCPAGPQMLERMMRLLTTKPRSLYAQFLYSQESWKFLTDMYRTHCTDPDFIDFFWTIRAMHEPIWLLGEIAARLIPAKMYHTVSTGYAGFLGALLHHKTGCPLLLSEHGIYTKERMIDLFQSDWLKDHRLSFEKGTEYLGYFQQLWIRFFEALGRMCYEAADPIVSLFDANRQRQIRDGADPSRTRIIPNGIPIERYIPLRKRRPSTPPPILCLIGRVVPIKDIKTFIRAMRTIVNVMPTAEGWIAGPEDEDPEYVNECRQLCMNLGLTAHVKFLGFQKVEDLFPRIGLLVLSSISEGLPLVVLEAFAAGVPAVTTDVGSCRQLIYGTGMNGDTDGAAGLVVNIANHAELAAAALGLLVNKGKWSAAQQAGIRRVEKFYTQTQMIDQYRAMYAGALSPWQESDSNYVKS